MQKINSASELKKAIKLLEEKQKADANRVKGSFVELYQTFSLVNIIKSAIKEFSIGFQGGNSVFSSLLGGIFPSFYNKKEKKASSNEASNEKSGIMGEILENIIMGYILKKPTPFKIIGALLLKSLLKKKKS